MLLKKQQRIYVRTEIHQLPQPTVPQAHNCRELYRCETTGKKVTWAVAGIFFVTGIVLLCSSGGSTVWEDGRDKVYFENPTIAYIGLSFFSLGPLIIATLICCYPRRAQEREPLIANPA